MPKKNGGKRIWEGKNLVFLAKMVGNIWQVFFVKNVWNKLADCIKKTNTEDLYLIWHPFLEASPHDSNFNL